MMKMKRKMKIEARNERAKVILPVMER